MLKLQKATDSSDGGEEAVGQAVSLGQGCVWHSEAPPTQPEQVWLVSLWEIFSTTTTDLVNLGSESGEEGVGEGHTVEGSQSAAV